MNRYYTRACNFCYGEKSKTLVRKKKTLPLSGNKNISFNKVEIISRKSKKILSLSEIYKLPKNLKTKIVKDIKLITKKKNIELLSFEKTPKIMGVLNITPDSFSDGGKFNRISSAEKHLKFLFKSGASVVDIGGESTRPGSKTVSSEVEWKRIKGILKKTGKKKIYIS